MSRRHLRAAAAAVLGLALVAVAAWAVRDYRYRRAAEANLAARVADTVQPAASDILPCAQVAPPGALVLLALGQSSAANHGEPSPAGPRVPMVTEQGCLMAADPLPGATGRGGSTWSRLPDAMALRPGLPPVLLSVLAVDATSVGEWTRADSPLRARLLRHLDRMAELGHPPGLVLWDQGAGDALRHTTPEAYRDGLRTLADLLRSKAPAVRILLAPTTVCRRAAATDLQDVVRGLVASDPRFGAGPLLDTLVPAAERYDGCHFTNAGLQRAATSWAQSIDAELAARR